MNAGVIRWLLHPGPRLAQRAVHAAFWGFGLRAAQRILETLRTVILARVLAPDDFGLMGVALLTIGLLETFTTSGFRSALIQRKGDIRSYLDTAWTVGVVRGLLLAGALVLMAPVIVRFFDAPGAASLLRTMALVPLLAGLSNIGIIHFSRELEFQKRFLFIVTRTMAEVSVGITLALILQNVWALVWGLLAGVAVRLIVSYILHPYRPRLRFEWIKFKELYGFGKWVFGTHVLSYLVSHVDDIIVGRVIGITALGFYRMAFNFSLLATHEILQVSGQVLFPAYAKLQNKETLLRRAYLKAFHFVALFSLPMGAGFFFIAPVFTDVVLGDKWLPMVPALQVLIVWGLSGSITQTTGPLFSGVGRPDLNTKSQLLNLILLGILIYPMAIAWGISGAAGAVLVAGVFGNVIRIIIANNLIGVCLRELALLIAYPTLSTVAMLLVLYGVQQSFQDLPPIWQLIWFIGLGATTYAVGIACCRAVCGYTAGGLLTKNVAAWFTSNGQIT